MADVMTDLQEAVARAICSQGLECKIGRRYPDDPNVIGGGKLWEAYTNQAQAAIETTIRALVSAGATNEMTHAARQSQASAFWTPAYDSIYRAMLLAKARELGINVEGMG